MDSPHQLNASLELDGVPLSVMGAENPSSTGATKKCPVLNGVNASLVNKNYDLQCPICLNLINEAYITRCGHTFCYQCILKSISIFKRCPKCNKTQSTEHLIPNFLLNDLILKYKKKLQRAKKLNVTFSEGLKDFISIKSQNLTLPDVNVMLEVLNQRKQLLEVESCTAQNALLYEFLEHLLKMKQEQQKQISKEIEIIESDMKEVTNILKDAQKSCPTLEQVEKSTKNTNANVEDLKSEMIQLLDTIETTIPKSAIDGTSPSNSTTPVTATASVEVGAVSAATTSEDSNLVGDEGFNSFKSQPNSSTFLNRKRRMYAYFDDFVQCYFTTRSKELYFGQASKKNTSTSSGSSTIQSGVISGATTTASTSSEPSVLNKLNNPEVAGIEEPQQQSRGYNKASHDLDTFRESLVKFSRYTTMRPLATLTYSCDTLNNSIVSSIEFDKDNEFFAIAGVTKMIKVFDYMMVIRDHVDIHYPAVEMESSSKISCLVWNSYHKSILASSDYDGTVSIWDTVAGERTKVFREHDKRCWSVDFSDLDTTLMASGSDDAKVKLWSLNVAASVATLEAKANVCCVKFNPKSSCHLAFGSADHCVHYYDLRNLKQPLCIFKGHKKAVSYVKFLNSEEIVSASTDSNLRLWNINQPPYSLRTYKGHINDKNFVGMTTDGDYIACGSEDNSLYVYYKGLTKPFLNLRIDGGRSVWEHDRTPDMNEFVSAVCWRKNCDVIVAANSRGIIKILQLC